MKKLITLILLPAVLTLTACKATPYNVEDIIKNDEPTYMNTSKIVEGSYIFIKKGELYVLSDNEGLNNKDSIQVKDTKKVFTTKVESDKERAEVFIGINDGVTEATINSPDGAHKTFNISVK